MKKLLKPLLWVLGILLLAILGFATYIHLEGIPEYTYNPSPDILNLKVEPDSMMVARGEKIAFTLCFGCHQGEDNRFTGKWMLDAPKEFGQLYSYNITQHPEKGIGSWTDGELFYFLRTGIRKDGSWAPIYMPKLTQLADEDIKSIIAWLRSADPRLAPSESEPSPNQPNFLVKLLTHVAFKAPPVPASPISLPDTNDLVALGRYVANGMADCYGCHSADFKTMDILNPEMTAGFYGGGNPVINMEGEVVPSANLTMDEETGIGKWTTAEFIQAVRWGKKQNGDPLSYPMFPHPNLTDREVEGIFAYLKTIPKIKNPVSRYQPK